MKLKNSQIVDALPVIKKISDLPLPIKTGLILLKNFKKLSDLYNSFNSSREALIAEHADKDESGKVLPVFDNDGKETDQVRIKDGLAFRKAVLDLLITENEIELETVSMESLGDAKLSVGELSVVEWLFN